MFVKHFWSIKDVDKPGLISNHVNCYRRNLTHFMESLHLWLHVLKSYGVLSPGQNPKLVAMFSLLLCFSKKSKHTQHVMQWQLFWRLVGFLDKSTSHLPLHPSDPQLMASVCPSNTCSARVRCSRNAKTPEKAGPDSDSDSLSEGKQYWQVCPPFLTLLELSSCICLIILHKNKNGFDPFKGIYF